MPARKKSSPRRRKPPADEIELAEDLDYAAKGGWRNVLQKVVDTLEAFRYQQQAEVLTEILEAGYRDPGCSGAIWLKYEAKQHQRLQGQLASLFHLDIRKLEPGQRRELAGRCLKSRVRPS